MQQAAAAATAVLVAVVVRHNSHSQYIACICRCTIGEFNYSIFVKHCYEIVFSLRRSFGLPIELNVEVTHYQSILAKQTHIFDESIIRQYE